VATAQTARPARPLQEREALSLPLLEAGFRPFFLLSGIWAAVAVGLWIPAYIGLLAFPSALAPMTWHLHEAIYGFGVAAVAGFLLTAVPTWTGRVPIAGRPLAGLALLWLAGRFFCFFSGFTGWQVAMVVDVAFLAVFFAVIAREILAGRNWRNLPPAIAVAILALGNAAVYLEGRWDWIPSGLGGRIGLAMLLLLITLIGGRIIPAFTRNWLAKQQRGPLPIPFNSFDRVVLLASVAGLLAWTAYPDALLTGALLLLAGILNLSRLARWRGFATFAEPLLTILHLGYFWLGFGLLLLGLELILSEPSLRGALHALAAGAAGTMILAVMTRASLGHSGRPLTAGQGTCVCYLLLTAAVVMRVVSPAVPAIEISLLSFSALAWIAAFGLFVTLYSPLFFRRHASS
jgi:uncharacterized protein involved in response to NO